MSIKTVKDDYPFCIPLLEYKMNIVFNLDCEPREYLRELWEKKGKQNATDCFPDKPKGYIKAYNDYRAYAINKVCAIDCRLKGEIATAIVYENICDNIYNSLPDFAQW